MTDYWDIANGIFEFFGGLFVWLNVKRLFRDKAIAGVSPVATAFFIVWGTWGLFYYPAIGQFWSAIGCISIVTANTTWIFLVWYYTYVKQTKQVEDPERYLFVGATNEIPRQETET